MPITEDHLEPGRWNWEYLPDTPRSVLDAIDIRNDTGLGGTAFASAFVTSAHIDPNDISASDLLDLAPWRGVITGMAPRRLGHKGYGLLHALGGERRGGTLRVPPDGTTPSRTLEGHLDDTVLLGTASANGLAKGSTIVTTAGFTMNLPAGTTRREMLDHVVLNRSTEYEYVVHPDGTIDAHTPATLFRQNELILTPQGGHEGAIESLRAGIELAELDVDNWASDIVADWDGTANYGSAANTVPNTWRGIAGDLMEWWDLLSFQPKGVKVRGKETVGKLFAAFLTSQTQANNFATREAGRRNAYRITITADIDIHNPWRHIHVGDSVYVYDPSQHIFDTTAAQVHFRGGTAFPQSHRAVSMTSPVREKYGKYIAHWDSSGNPLVSDVTRWVAPEDSTTTIDLGARRKFSRGTPRPGPINQKRLRRAAVLTILSDRLGTHRSHRR